MALKVKRVFTALISALVVATLVVTPSSTAYQNMPADSFPEIKNFEANSKYVNPNSQVLQVSYYLTQNAYVSATIDLDGTVVKKLFTEDFQGQGNNTFSWDGTDNKNNYVSDGEYVLTIKAYNDKGDYGYKYTFFADYSSKQNDNDKNYYDPNNNNSYDYKNKGQKYSDPYNDGAYLITQESSSYSFNPMKEDLKIKFQLNQPTEVTLDIMTSGGILRTLFNDEWKKSNVIYTATWDGTNSAGNLVDDGQYKYRITLGNGNQYYGNIAVYYDGKKPNGYYNDYKNPSPKYFSEDGSLNVYGQKAEPSVFNPKSTKDETKISYNLSESAFVTVLVRKKNGGVVRTLIDNKVQSSGYHMVKFDGKDDDNDWLPEGLYTVQIKSKKSGQSDAESVTVEIDYGIYSSPKTNYEYNPKVTDYKAQPNSFDPVDEKTKITYHTNVDGYVTLRIMDGSKLVKMLIDGEFKTKGDHAHLWDGTNSYGQYVADGTYQFTISLYNNKGDDYVKANVEVDHTLYGKSSSGSYTYYGPNGYKSNSPAMYDNNGYYYDGYKDGYLEKKKYEPTNYNFSHKVKVLSDGDTYNYDYYDYNAPAEECADFKDVNTSSKYCDAIKFVKDHQIFNGYHDGYFYPNKAIQRDEALRVVMETFNLDAMPAEGGQAGFLDVNPDAWYMPYLRAAKYLGIIHGYPDGLFRPYQSINRVEFTKIFVETARDKDGIALSNCNYKPYVDTPITWYTNYVCYAKDNNLVKTVDPFHYQPGKLITRGEVAEFVYNYYENK